MMMNKAREVTTHNSYFATITSASSDREANMVKVVLVGTQDIRGPRPLITSHTCSRDDRLHDPFPVVELLRLSSIQNHRSRKS